MRYYEIFKRKIVLPVFGVILFSLTPPDVNSQSSRFDLQQYYQKFSYNQDYSSLTSDSVLTKVGRWGWGPCYSVALKDNYAFIGNGMMLQVLDISDASHPEVVGELYTGTLIRKIIISGNYAYTITPFQIFDISDPTHPVLAQSVNLPDVYPPTAITVNKNYIYIGDFYGFIFTIDVTDPYNPDILDGRMLASGEIVQSIAVKDTILYAVTYDSPGIDVYSISNPYAPYHIKLTGLRGSSLAINNHYLYLGTGGLFSIYDISNLASPKSVTEIDVSSFVRSISVSDSIAYLIQDTIGVTQLDISDTSNIHITSQIKNPYSHPYDDPLGGQVGGAVSFPYAYLASGTGLWIVNVEKPDTITSESFYPTAWYVNQMAFDSTNHAYLAELHGGLKILDISDPSSPELTGYYYDNEQVKDVVVANDLAYLLCDLDLQVVDVSDPVSPKLLGKVFFNDTISTNPLGEFYFLCLNGSTVYVARKSQKLFTVDVGNPNYPKIKNIYSLKVIPVGITQANSYLYVAGFDESGVMPNNEGIQLFNISNPIIPVESGLLKINGPTGITTYNNSLFTVGQDTALKEYGIEKYDISNPSHLIFKYLLDNLPPGINSFLDINAEDNYLYLTYNTSFIVVDISQPDSGAIVYLANSYTNPNTPGAGTFNSIAVNNNIVLTGYLGVTVYNNNLVTGITEIPSLPGNFELFQNYPNPFNSSTLIRYTLSTSSHVTLKIYDILGREVETLVKSIQQAGDYVVSFDASVLSSGVYFYRLEVFTKDGKRSVSVKKMELLK